jgi:hypothetical protein
MITRFLAGAALAAALASPAPARQAEAVQVDEKAGTVSFGAKVAQFDKYEQLKGAIEYLLVMPGGKEYEAVLVAAIDPVALYEGMKKIGLAPGKSGSQEDKTAPEGGKLKITVSWKDGDKERKEPAETLVLDALSNKPMEQKPWIFNGSREVFNPAEGKMTLGALNTKNVVALYWNDSTVLVQPSLAAKDAHQFKVNKASAPKSGTAVRVTFESVK